MAFYEWSNNAKPATVKEDGIKLTKDYSEYIGPRAAKQLMNQGGVPIEFIEGLKPYVSYTSDDNLTIDSCFKNKIPGHVRVATARQFKNLMNWVNSQCDTVSSVGSYGFEYSTISVNNLSSEVMDSSSRGYRDAAWFAFVIECTQGFKKFRFSVLVRRSEWDEKGMNLCTYDEVRHKDAINKLINECIIPYTKSNPKDFNITDILDFVKQCREATNV